MDTRDTLDHRNLSHDAGWGWLGTLVGFGGRFLRRLAFGVLRLFEPVVVPFLLWLAAGGVALWVIFVWIAHDSAFPTSGVLLMSVGCLLGAGVYCVALELLRPAGH